MNKQQEKIVGCVGTLVKIFVQLPIWLYLMHVVLSAIEASDLAWFLFWIYVPISFGVAIFSGVIAVLFTEAGKHE